MSEQRSKQETIELLRELVSLQNQEHDSMHHYDAEDDVRKKLMPIVSKARDFHINSALTAVFNSLPIYPKTDLTEAAKKDKIRKLALLAGIPLAIIGLTISTATGGVLIMALIIGGIMTKDFTENYKQLKNKYDEEVNKYNESMESFRKSLAMFEQNKEQGIAEAKKHSEIYRKQLQLFKNTVDDYNAKVESLYNDAMQCQEEINDPKFSFLANDYKHLAGSILELLESGRADTFKEALNLAIKEEREEDERYERRRHEEEMQYIAREDAENKRLHYEQMQEEAHKQTELAASQAAEAERHNRQMEYERKRHNAAMENAMRR